MSDLRTSLLLEELLDDSFPEMLERLSHQGISDEDLTRIVNAVNGLRPSATADEIAKAIKTQLQDVTLTVPASDSSAVVEAIHDLKEILDHRFQGLGRAFGASGPSNIASDANRLLGHVTVDNFPAVTEITNDSGSPVPVSGTVSVTEPVSIDDNGGSITVDGAINPNRPTQQTGRTHKHIVGRVLTETTTLYTVTAGKTLYVTNFVFSGRNSDVVGGADLCIRDGTTDKIPITIAAAVAGAVVPFFQTSAAYVEPVQFTTNVEFQELIGQATASMSLTGYEE